MIRAAQATEQQKGAPSKDEQPEDSSQEQAAPKKIRLQRTRKVVSWLLAIDAWKRQAGHLKRRSSFPLLRKIIQTEKNQSQQSFHLSEIPTPVLERSLLSHCLVLLIVVPASAWAIYTTLKGLSAGLRFDIWFNAWLLQGIPLLIFCSMKVLTSNMSRALIQRELFLRAKTTNKD